MARRQQLRLGRPPASSATDTRLRILEVACEVFAANGYGATTNTQVATQAGITAGALYYYFDSKLDMYLAVFRHLQATIDGRIMAATESQSTFDAKLRAILEVAHQLNAENPTIARFQGTARIDRVRHPELASAIPNPPGEGAGFMQELLDAGERTGEIRPERRDQVAALVRTIMVGLVVSSTQDPADQRTAIDGMFALLDRTLVQPPRHAARP